MGERLEDLMKSVLEDIKNQEYKQAYLFFRGRRLSEKTVSQQVASGMESGWRYDE